MSRLIRSAKTWSAAFALALAGLAAASPASAVSFNSTFGLNRFNSGGTSFVNMTASSTTFCYLSEVGVTETDTGGEVAKCEITRGPIVWTMTASLGTSSDADIQCNAICFNN